MRQLILAVLILSASLHHNAYASYSRLYPISGMVIDRHSREGIAHASVTVLSEKETIVTTDEHGNFIVYLTSGQPCRFIAVQQGYHTESTETVDITGNTPLIRITLDRKISKSSITGIDRMIQLADVMKKDIRQDSLFICFYAENLARRAALHKLQSGKYPKKWIPAAEGAFDKRQSVRHYISRHIAPLEECRPKESRHPASTRFIINKKEENEAA